MKTRSLGIIFIAAVIVPSILLAVLSIRATGREEAFVEKQLATTLLAEVTQTAGLVTVEMGKVLDELRAGVDVPADADYARILAAWQRSSALVSVPFLLSPRYGILWPRSSSSLGAAERVFLNRNGDFLSDRATISVLENIAVRYRDEILAETKRIAAEVAKDSSVDDRAAAAPGAKSAEASAELADAADSAAAGAAGPAGAAAATSEAEADVALTPRASDALANQMALDAFAQSPAIQIKVYEEAQEKGDQVSTRVAQPVSKLSQNAAPTARAAPTVLAAPTARAARAAQPASLGESAKKAEAVEREAPAFVPAEQAATAGAQAAEPAPPAGGVAPGATGGAAVGAGTSKQKEASPLVAPASSAAAAPKPPAQQASQYVVTSQLLSQIASRGDSGLIPRLIGEELVFLFWERQKDGRIAGCEISAPALRERMAGVLTATYTPVRVLTIIDERGNPLATPADSATRDWRQPFVSREISEALPRWEVAAYLASPDTISSKARSSSLVVWILVVILFVSVAGGGTMVLSSVYGEMRLAQAKATFVTNVSHELKTPLTSISLFVELLRQKRQPDAARRERYLSLMASETERLTRLINNVLDFSASSAKGARGRGRPGQGRRRYAPKLVDLAEIARELVESQRVRLESRGFALRFIGCDGGLPVRADPEAMKQILLNLLSNAEKYSADRKEIEVEAEHAPAAGTAAGAATAAAHIHVRDRGIGVAEKDRQRIFREFFRVDDSLATRVQGTGLGLTIARAIARDHDGDVTCRPREGGGSDFVLHLPVSGEGKGEA
jgi:signal transduction histidine kinase